MTSSPASTYFFVQLPPGEEIVVAGRYVLREGNVGALVYARSYLARSNAYPLDPVNLPLKAREFRTTKNEGMFGALRDAAPDAWGRLVMNRRGVPGTELDFLLATSDTRIGALSFGPSPEVPPLDLGGALALEKLAPTLQAATDVQTEVAGETPVQEIDPELLAPTTSLGGARPKATVIDGSGQLWIAKFPARNDPWDNAVVEHGLLRLARECGIQSPDSRLIDVAGHRVLLVQRFDFRPGPRRRSVLSAHSLLDLDTGADRRAREGWSYNDLAHVVRGHSEVHQADARELFRRITFNALTSNEDDHPRNHAFLRTDTGWRLSPAYDLTPSRTKDLETRMHAMRIGRRDGVDPRLMRASNLVSAARDFLLEETEARDIIDEMNECVRNRWRDVLRGVGASENTLALVEHAFPASFY